MNDRPSRGEQRMAKRMLVMEQMIKYWKDCGFSDEKIEEMLSKMSEKLKERNEEKARAKRQFRPGNKQ